MKRLFTLFSALWVSLFLFQAHGVTIGDGTFSYRAPYYFYSFYSTTQSIYTASEIGGAMEIDAIAYNVARVSSITVSSLEIYMGHRANDEFASSSDCETLDNLTLVYSGAPTLASSYGWEPIALDTPFSYNGQDHLVVVVCKKSSFSYAEYYQSRTSKTQCLLRDDGFSSNYSDPSNSSNYSTAPYRPNIMLIGSDYVKDGIIYDIDSEEAVVVGALTMSADVTIPAAIEIEGKSYNVTSIAKYAFCGNDKLKSLIIPNSVTSIGYNAFYNCYRLTHIYANSPTPANILNKMTFECSTDYVRDPNDIYTYATLHVPMGSKDDYASAYEWRYFNKIKEDMTIDGNTYYTTLEINQGTNGFVQHYVKADDTYTLYIGAENHGRVNTVLFNGIDVTDQLVDGYYTTPAITHASKLSISFEQTQGAPAMLSDALHVYGYDGKIYVTGLDGSQQMSIYTIEGKLIRSLSSAEDSCFDVSDGDYVVKVGDRTFKVVL